MFQSSLEHLGLFFASNKDLKRADLRGKKKTSSSDHIRGLLYQGYNDLILLIFVRKLVPRDDFTQKNRLYL